MCRHLLVHREDYTVAGTGVEWCSFCGSLKTGDRWTKPKEPRVTALQLREAKEAAEKWKNIYHANVATP